MIRMTHARDISWRLDSGGSAELKTSVLTTDSQQVGYRARIGQAVLENPELPLRLIQDKVQDADRYRVEDSFDWTLSRR
jgi:hypothetical protein